MPCDARPAPPPPRAGPAAAPASTASRRQRAAGPGARGPSTLPPSSSPRYRAAANGPMPQPAIGPRPSHAIAVPIRALQARARRLAGRQAGRLPKIDSGRRLAAAAIPAPGGGRMVGGRAGAERPCLVVIWLPNAPGITGG